MFQPPAVLRRSPHRVWVVFAVAVAMSSACGSSSTTPSTSWEFTGSLAEFTEAHHVANHHDFQAGKAGTATIKLSWANENVELELDVTGQSCSDDQFFQQLQAGSHSGNNCIAPGDYSGSGDLTSEELLLEVQKNQKIRVWIVNWGPGSQDYKVTVNIQ